MSVEAVKAVLGIRTEVLTTAERFVLVCLAEHAGPDADGRLVAFPSGTTLAKETGLTREYVQACLKTLRDHRLIYPVGKRRRVNVYAIRLALIQAWHQATPAVVSTEPTLSCELSPHTPVNSPDTEPPNEPPVEPTTDGHADDFTDFWEAYPRKVSKVAARRAWPRAAREAGGAALIIAGAKAYAADPNRVPQFTKHPTTWLNAGCWEDDALPPRQGAMMAKPSDTHHDYWSNGGGFTAEEGREA